MKNSILLILISLSTLNLIAQDKVAHSLTIDNLIGLSNMSKQDADDWLTKENNFAFFQENKKFDASVYTFDYNSESKKSPMWLYYFDKTNEVFVIAKKSDVSELLEQLEVNKFLSNLNPDGTLITTYLVKGKEFIVTITSKKQVSIRVIPSPEDESGPDKKIRHNRLIKKN